MPPELVPLVSLDYIKKITLIHAMGLSNWLNLDEVRKVKARSEFYLFLKCYLIFYCDLRSTDVN